MELTLVRRTKTDRSTIGDLLIHGAWFCYTLEDKERPLGEKIDGKTAIPLGTYVVVIDYSPRFQRDMPHLLDVPGFEGIRIHPGNTDADTSGCVLVGYDKGPDFIGKSQLAFTDLFVQLQQAARLNEQILIHVKDLI